MAFAPLRRPTSKNNPSAPARASSFRSSRASAAGPAPVGTGPELRSSTASVTELGFHVGRFDVETTGALEFPESVKPTLENPNAVVTADVCARPTTAAGRSELSSWTVGLSRSIYEDYSLYSYERSDVSKRFSDAAPGGAIDVDVGDGLPFDKGIGRHGGAISASFLDRNPTRLQIIDAPNMEIPMTHDVCEDKNPVRAVTRLMDFSVFLMARNDQSHEVHTLRHIGYRQITQIRFSDAAGRTKEELDQGQLAVEGRVATIHAHGRAQVHSQGDGEGPRPPRLGGSLANDIAEQTIVVEKPGC